MPKGVKNLNKEFDLMIVGGQLVTVSSASKKPKIAKQMDDLGIIDNF